MSKIFCLGSGFIADHLRFDKIADRIKPDIDQINHLLKLYKPDVLINCIGKTGRPNIDWCESHQEETIEANTTIPVLVAEVCQSQKIHFINLASGCIFYGRSPNFNSDGSDAGWVEDDQSNAISVYSKSKRDCDAKLSLLPNTTSLRLRMPVSEKNLPRNLINKLRGYKQIIDIPNSMTFVSDLVRCIDWVIKERPSGIFHITNPQPLSAARIMTEYQKYIPSHQFDIITEEQLDQLTTAKRSNCLLSTAKINSAGFTLTNSEEALSQCMKQYIDNIGATNGKS